MTRRPQMARGDPPRGALLASVHRILLVLLSASLALGSVGALAWSASHPRLPAHPATAVAHAGPHKSVRARQQTHPRPRPAQTRAHPAARSRVKRRPQPRPRARPIASRSYVVLMVLDGARPDYYNVPGIPHVRALLRNGTQYPNALDGILESETPSGHATIASGSEPRHDGILSFDWQTGDNLPVDLFAASAIQSGQMERVMRQARATTIAGLVHR